MYARGDAGVRPPNKATYLCPLATLRTTVISHAHAHKLRNHTDTRHAHLAMLLSPRLPTTVVSAPLRCAACCRLMPTPSLLSTSAITHSALTLLTCADGKRFDGAGPVWVAV